MVVNEALKDAPGLEDSYAAPNEMLSHMPFLCDFLGFRLTDSCLNLSNAVSVRQPSDVSAFDGHHESQLHVQLLSLRICNSVELGQGATPILRLRKLGVFSKRFLDWA